GRIVEEADVFSLFREPKHPYTQALIASTPVLGEADKELYAIPGSVPNLIDLPPGCKFSPRCAARVEHELEICTHQEPRLFEVEPDHLVRSWLFAYILATLNVWKRINQLMSQICELSESNKQNTFQQRRKRRAKVLLEVKNLVKYFP